MANLELNERFPPGADIDAAWDRGLEAIRKAAVNALALALALGSSFVWGTADFSGGALTRRLPAFAVTVVSQAAGFVALLLVFAVRGDLASRSFAYGLVAGVGGGIGLAAFYRALSLGTMSVVSPIAACGAVVPFGISIASGERPTALAIAGAGAALVGAVLASAEERRSDSPERARAVALAVFSAVALGIFIYFLGLGSRRGTRCRRSSERASARSAASSPARSSSERACAFRGATSWPLPQ